MTAARTGQPGAVKGVTVIRPAWWKLAAVVLSIALLAAGCGGRALWP
jgi:hypothetical protein